MNPHLDHIIWACHDLEQGCRRFEALTGVSPRFGGTHTGGLTHNALVGLGGRCYLEILAPAAPAGPRDDDWCRFARASLQPRVFTYCMRSALPLTDLASLALTLGCHDAVVAGNGRITPDGTRLRWQWLGPKFDSFGYAFPFFIDWLDSPHPGESFAAAVPESRVRLQRFAVGHPRATALRALLEQVGAPVDTFAAPDLQFHVQVDTPLGVVAL